MEIDMHILAVVPPSPAQWDVTTRNTRNSWESWERSDSVMTCVNVPGYGRVPVTHTLGTADAALLTRLAVAGGDHGKFLRTLPVQVEARATSTFLRHLYTYRAGVALLGDNLEPTDITINSTSVMHTAGRRAFIPDDVDWRGVDADVATTILAAINVQREVWIAAGKRRDAIWRGLVNLIPGGWWYTIHLSINYAVARSMWQSRRNHRLSDDWGVLCESFGTLPNAELITTRRD
jgi:hypothetical protein